LSSGEVRQFLALGWNIPAISTLDAEAAAATIGVTVGNFRLLEFYRLRINVIMKKVEVMVQ
jgi:hypothetical protein